ncbi:MAG: preprotein translocase subunit SecG [Bacilli bacterium]|nr:preprotein translocase subunit SecG [Bacilli bacterium]
MTFWDILLLIVSVFLIIIIVLQDSKEDSSNTFTGEKSELFANKKERGIELWIKRITFVLCVIFFVLAIICSFFIAR